MIQSPEAGNLWSFWDFEYLTRAKPIEEWRQKDLSDEARIVFDELLKTNQKVERFQDWVGFRKYMEGKLKQERVWELGFKADGRQYRILGKFGNQRKQAILLIGCYHKMNIYHPVGCLETAYKRSRSLTRGEATIRERKIGTDI